MLKSKTTWTAITGALAGVAGYFTGELELGAAINVVITSLGYVRFDVFRIIKNAAVDI